MLFTDVKTLAAYAALSSGFAIRYSAAPVGPGVVSDAKASLSNSMLSATKGLIDAQ